VLRLAYNAVGSTWASPLSIPESTLFVQLRLLRQRGYVGLTYAEAERRSQAGTLPERTAVITFDGGYGSVLRAVAALNCVGFPATVFVVAQFVESGQPMRWPGVEDEPARHMRSLSWLDLERLVDAGWEVGSNTVSHPRLTELADDGLAEELGASRELIAARLGSCRSVAYPYGLADQRVAQAAAAAGYEGGCTLAAGEGPEMPFLRPRRGLTPSDTGLWLRVQLAAGLRMKGGRGDRRQRRLRRRRERAPAA
jgi:peptidoglycan/xylan/chitin deacetylase (PgdA/CDA1 family)